MVHCFLPSSPYYQSIVKTTQSFFFFVPSFIAPPSKVHHLVGVAVTPVVCFLGEIGESELNPNPSEVAECFTVPLESFLDRNRSVGPLFDCQLVSLSSLQTNLYFITDGFTRSIMRHSLQVDHI